MRRCDSTARFGARCVLEPHDDGHHCAAKDPTVPVWLARQMSGLDLVWWHEPTRPLGPRFGPGVSEVPPGPDRRPGGEIAANPALLSGYARRDDAAYGDWIG